ncbi:polysaccharide lyase family 8 super-sandwich domain-containing protein [Marinicrinis lubricantis]|uniref:Polysaccharide lyase family 8 super-sandwich domain-containing protein n=1 Tax=Marinicrinis lubricantis TaxID=2086470 RepID=A0ABW1ILN7_9BACL
MVKEGMRKAGMMCLLLMIILAAFMMYKENASADQSSDEFDELRLKWRYYLTGENMYELPVTEPELQARIDRITADARAAWNEMNTEADRDFLWENVHPNQYPDSAHIYENYKRLYRMAIAYCTKGSDLEGNAEMLDDLIQGLDWVYEHQYNERLDWQVNYHHWEINIPTLLAYTTVLLYDELGEERVDHYMNAVHKFAHDPTTYALSTTPSYGANRLSESLPIALRGILVKDGERLALVRDRLGDFEALIYPFVKQGNGWYRDGSFISHDRHAYNGTYGLEQYNKLISLVYLLEDSTWEIEDPRLENVYLWTNDGYLPLVHKGRMMDMVNGRSIARPGASDHVQGNKLIDSLLLLTEFADSKNAALYKQNLKQWAQGKADFNYMDSASIPLMLRMKDILEDNSVAAAPVLTYRQYAGMDRAVQQRPSYAFGLSMFSERIYDFETVHGENKRGWYTSSGMTYIYDQDYTQYNDNYWATVNMKRLPGTTVDAQYERPEGDSNKRSSASWVGGVEIAEQFGASGMELEGYGTTLTARKSWFAFDDEIVALGSNIGSQDQRTIETIVENRRLNKELDQLLTIDGEVQPSSLGWASPFDQIRWAHLEGSTEGADIGYVFPDGASIHALREERSGTWSDVSDMATDPNTYSNRYLTLWFDHGKNPQDESYRYIVLPDRSSEQVAQYSSQPDVTVLEQNEYVHAVKENRLNVLAALFWSDVKRTVDGMLTVDKKAAVAVHDRGEELEISVSDPTQENEGIIEVELNQSASGVVSSDSSIKVLQLSPTIRLAVQTHGSGGRTQRIILTRNDAAERTAASYVPVADASIHHGSKASENFGTATTLSVRDAGDETKNRRAFLKFDLATAESVNRAVLRVHGYSDSGEYGLLNVLGSGNQWSETELTWNNAPPYESSVLDAVFINGMEKYYELDVTDYVKQQLAGGRNEVTLVLAGTDYENILLPIHSKEHSYGSPQLWVEGTFHTGAPPEIEDPTYGKWMTKAVEQYFDHDTPGSIPAHWNIQAEGGEAVTIQPAGSNGDLELKLQSGGEPLTALLPFEQQEGLVYTEFRMKSGQTNSRVNVSLESSDHESPVIELVFDERGRITASNGKDEVWLQSYSKDGWYKIQILADTAAGTYDVYMDEVRKAARLSFRQQTDALDAAKFEVQPSGLFFVDDVSVGTTSAMQPAPSEEDQRNSDDWNAQLPIYTVSDHFNGEEWTNGWSFNETGGTVQFISTPSGSNRSLRLMNLRTGQTGATRTFDSRTGKVTVEYWVLPEQRNQTFGAPYVRDSANRDLAVILFNGNGNIQAFNGAAAQNIKPYEAGEWVHIRLDMDTYTKTYDLYLNGQLAASQFGFRRTDSTGVGRLFFFSNAAAGSLYLDNVRVTSEEDRFKLPHSALYPGLTISAPERALPGETFQAALHFDSKGYIAEPERMLIHYDREVFTYEGAEDGSVEYDVQEVDPGTIMVMKNDDEYGGELPKLSFSVLEQANGPAGSIRLAFSEVYLVQEGMSIQTPGHSISIAFQEDQQPPNTLVKLFPEYPNGMNGWYIEPLSVTLEVYDDRSGPSSLSYSMDHGVTWHVYEQPVVNIPIHIDGDYTLLYLSTDRAGNMENEKSVHFRLDQTAPQVLLNIAEEAVFSNEGEMKLELSVSDEGSGVDAEKTVVKLDGTVIHADESIALYRLTPGLHVLTVQVYDFAGNVHERQIRFYTETSVQALKSLVLLFAANGEIDQQGIANSLLVKLEKGSLSAFVNELNAQRGKHISIEAADILLRDAMLLLD